MLQGLMVPSKKGHIKSHWKTSRMSILFWSAASCTLFSSVLQCICIFNGRYENILVSVSSIQVLSYSTSAGAGFLFHLNLFHNPFFFPSVFLCKKGKVHQEWEFYPLVMMSVCCCFLISWNCDILTLPKSQIQLKMGFFQPKYAAFFKLCLSTVCG